MMCRPARRWSLTPRSYRSCAIVVVDEGRGTRSQCPTAPRALACPATCGFDGSVAGGLKCCSRPPPWAAGRHSAAFIRPEEQRLAIREQTVVVDDHLVRCGQAHDADASSSPRRHGRQPRPPTRRASDRGRKEASSASLTGAKRHRGPGHRQARAAPGTADLPQSTGGVQVRRACRAPAWPSYAVAVATGLGASARQAAGRRTLDRHGRVAQITWRAAAGLVTRRRHSRPPAGLAGVEPSSAPATVLTKAPRHRRGATISPRTPARERAQRPACSGIP